MREAFTRAIRNVARFGDTDIFPFPIERHVFHDNEHIVLELLLRIHAEFYAQKDPSNKDNILIDSYLDAYPPVNASALAQVGYAGFRWATQLDPIWDLYLLGLVVSLAERIESARIPINEHSVFSYRFLYSDSERTLFDTKSSWREFMTQSIERAKNHDFVVSCDIGDFYPRVYHHRIENALLQVAGDTDIPKRIDRLLIALNPGRVSYGLPIGGNAARILAESLLNSTDKLLRMNEVPFCRYVDDYHMFASTKEDAFRHLIFLSEKLLVNEGLSLQKSKTRIMSSAEFIQSAQFTLGIESEPETRSITPRGRDLEAARFMRLHIRFDPYSDDPEGDFERTKDAVDQFDVFGMLSDEIGKSRIHGSLVKHLLKAAKILPNDVLDDISSVLSDNLAHLAPVFPQVMLLFREIINRLSPERQSYIFKCLIDLIKSKSPVLQLELHKMYAIRVLQAKWTDETESTLVRLFNDGAESPLVRKEILLTMAKWGNHSWLSDVLKRFGTFNPWERRAAIVGSYRLRDEGRHWRSGRARTLDPFEVIVQKWAAEKFKNNGGWDIPL